MKPAKETFIGMVSGAFCGAVIGVAAFSNFTTPANIFSIFFTFIGFVFGSISGALIGDLVELAYRGPNKSILLKRVENTLIGAILGSTCGTAICMVTLGLSHLASPFLFFFEGLFFGLTKGAIVGGIIGLAHMGPDLGSFMGCLLGVALITVVVKETNSPWLNLFLCLLAISACTGSGWLIDQIITT